MKNQFPGHKSARDLLAGYTYTWNQRNQLTAIDFLPDGINSAFDYSGESVAYDYDNRHQLIEADYAGLTDEEYEYDENGNRVSGGFTVGTNNRLLSDGTFDYEYDNEGNRIKRTNISTGDYTAYVWDHRNRLTHVIEFDDNGTPTDLEDNFATSFVFNGYDAQNRLIRRYVDADGNPFTTGDAEQTIFLWQHGQIALQFDGAGSSDLDYEDLSHRYLWGPAVDMLLADEQVDWSDSDADGEVLWALTDHLGTVRDIIDNEGDVVDHAEYDAFGNRLSAAAVDVVFGYTGKLFDDATGLQNNWNRWYDPAVGRWASEDFIWDGTNKNAYVGNSSTLARDTTGLFNEDLFWLNVNKLNPEFAKWWQINAGSIQQTDLWFFNARPTWDGSGRPLAYIDEDLNEFEAALAFAALAQGMFGPGANFRAELICNSDDPAKALQAFWRRWYADAVMVTKIGAEGYMAFLTVANEGVDFVITVNDVATDVSQGELSSAAINSIAALPFVTGAMIHIIFGFGGKIRVPQAVEFFRQTGKLGEGFEDFTALKKHLGEWDGHSWHHLVQQHPANSAKFGACNIHNTSNVINLLNGLHDDITNIQIRKIEAITGNRTQTVTQWIGQFDYETQWKFGEALFEYAATGKWPVGYQFPRMKAR